MARERWFYSQNHQRRGPVPLNQLVESVLAQNEPRSTLVWRKGFADWTRAEDIPEVERRIVPFLTRKEEEEAARRPARPASTSISVERRAPPPPPSQSIPVLVYGGIAAGVAATGFVAWLLWPRAEPAPQPLPLGGTSTENAPAVVIPGPGSGGPPARVPPTASAQPFPTAPPPTAPPATPPPAAALPAPTAAPPVAVTTPPPAPPRLDQEVDIPKPELIKLRQVAAWSGTSLELTVYNGTAFRVTEVFVTVQRFVGDDMVDDDNPIRLLPPAAGVDAGVASLLNKVAPERAKPGVNPLDTGKFVGQAGPAPEAYRCQIVAARGYATR
jgi:hypothetical protein